MTPLRRVKSAGRILGRRPVRDYTWMTAGIILTAWGLDSFLIPNKIAAGGVSGLATVIYYLAKARGVYLPVGMQMLAMNVVLVAIAMRTGRGWHYAAKTIYGIVGLSIAIDVFARFVPHLASDDLLLAALYGGVLAGVGLGMVFKAGGNTGGTDLIAQMLSRKVSLGVGQLMLLADAVVTVIAGLVFGWQFALYAVVAIFVSGQTVDIVLEGLATEKAAFIISEESVRIGEAITGELGRGATAIAATGVYTGEPRGMLFVAVSRKELDDLKAIVGAIDPTALVIISDVHEAIGEGFKEMRV
jgi:uncharacterized membrane-anchored protein YitT (DUF2179 family)